MWAAPGRVNLIGEHTDYNDGFVLPVALDRTTLAAVRRRPDGTVRAWTTRPGAARRPVTVSLRDARPGGVPGWAAYPVGVLWALREPGADVPGVDLCVDSDVPVGAGLSSSAALECAVALGVAELLGLGWDRPTLARLARRAENDFVGAPTGIMDQMAALCAVAGSAVFLDCRTLATEPVPLGLAAQGLALVVVDTRAPHALVSGAYADRRAACQRAAAVLGVPALRDATPAEVAAARDRLGAVDHRRARHVTTENERVQAAVALLRAGQAAGLGPLLDASHASLRDDFEVSCPELDLAVAAARDAGALGARMTGGGFGGSAVALVPAGAVEGTAAAVAAAFAGAGFADPEVFAVVPAAGARRVC